MKYVLLLFSFVMLILYSCSKKETLIGDTYVSLAYKQTYCSDKWMNSSEDSLTLKNVGHYLDSLDLYIAGLTIKQDAQAESCFACFCKTGKTIYVTTFDNDAMKAKYLAIGFK